MAIVADTFHGEDAGTNTVVTISEFIHKTSGTPAAGLGAAIALGAEDSAGNAEQAIQIQGYLSTVTNGSEQGVFLLRVKNSGAFMDALQITVAANTVTYRSNQTTVNLFDSTVTTLNMGSGSCAFNFTGTLDVSGHGIFGASGALSTQHVLVSHESTTLTSTTFVGAYLRVIPNAAGTSSCSFYGARSEIPYNTAQSYTATDSSCYLGVFNVAAASTISRGHGVYAVINRAAAGTVTDYRGFLSTASLSTTTVTTAYGIYLDKIGAGTTEYGLYVADLNTAGTNYAIYTNAGAIRFGDSITIADAKNIILDTTTGTKIGTATSQKLGFWNVTPIIQPASANQAALSLDVDVTGADTVDKAAINTNFTNIQTLVNQLRSDLVAAGIIKGSA